MVRHRDPVIGVIACVSAVALQRCPIDHLKHALPHRVRIPEQHAQVAVPADRGHLRRREPHLEEAAESLVPQVVEMEVLQVSPPPDALPGQPEGVVAPPKSDFDRQNGLAMVTWW